MRASFRAKIQSVLPLALVAITVACLAVLGSQRGLLTRLAGDEPTYLRMTESLVVDGDFAFDEVDRARLASAPPELAGLMILQRGTENLRYSKPVVYSLLAAPFLLVLGKSGLILFNVLSLCLAAWAARRWARAGGAKDRSLTLVTFFCAGAVLPYVAWMTSDLLQFVLVTTGLCLCAAEIRLRLADAASAPSGPALVAGGLLLGLAVAARVTNLPLALAAVAAALLCRHYRSAARILAAITVVALLGFGLNYLLAGSWSPYLSDRASFGAEDPVELGGSEEVQVQRLIDSAQSKVRIRQVRPAVSAYSTLYFFVGRHSGLLVYFPMALLLGAWLFRKPDRVTAAFGLGALAVVAVYLVYLPHNYFGGGSCIGNRYFLPVYGALLPALTHLPRRRWLLAPWAIAAVAFTSSLLSVTGVPEAAGSTQSHAYAGVFRWLPYETTAENLEGHAEKYWRRPGVGPGDARYRLEWDFVRFVDPFSEPHANSFRLTAGERPAELLVARRDGAGKLRFLVRSQRRDLGVRFADWGKEVLLAPTPSPAGGMVVEFEPSTSWRRHQFWFYWELDSMFGVQTFRLALETPDGSPASAEIHYLADEGLPLTIYGRKVVSVDLPERAVAGEVSRVPIRVRNKSEFSWTSDNVTPIFVGYKTRYEDRESSIQVDGPRVRLPGTVPPGGLLKTDVEIRWPSEPGRYRVEIDLVAEGVSWFAERAGGPLGAATVVVEPPVG